MRLAFSAMRFFVPHSAVILLATIHFLAAEEPISLFDGKSLAGWTGPAREDWRVEEGALVLGDGKSPHVRENWLATEQQFGNFELTFQAKTEGDVGTGMFFRSGLTPGRRIVGWQCDVGQSFDGGLYKEGVSGGMVAYPAKDQVRKVIKLNDWNDYKVRATGRRIQTFVNGTLMADYRDRSSDWRRTGVLALEQSAHGSGQARFRAIRLTILPEEETSTVEPAGPQERLTDKISPAKTTPWPESKFLLEPGDIVVFTGPENVVLEQRGGWLESLLTQHWQAAAPKFRHMGWEGDTVYRQNRMEAWGSWPENLEGAGATVVFAWFGQLEAFDSTKSVEDFRRTYGALLDEFAKRTPRIVVLGPTAFEKPQDPRLPDNTSRNERVWQHHEAARRLAAERRLVFVDLFDPSAPAKSLTRDGMHLNDTGLAKVAQMAAKALGAPETSAPEPLRLAVVEKNRLWFDTWRCMNWAFAYGDRTSQPFATGADGKPRFVDELKKFQPLLAHADATIHALAKGAEPPAPPPRESLRSNPPAISPQEELAKFQVRPGFTVNLFADEKLGVVRPVQIRWDENGRLWVACAPAYPQLEPGEHGNDSIIVLEDTDHDGTADKTFTYATGLTIPLGFEFGPWQDQPGVFVCESTQLVHLRDTDGDGRADARSVVLSGFGTGDTHQNINSLRWGPDGCLWFTQGYHIWSYVETPHGLAELNRSGLWRLNPRTMQLDSFLNESAAGLNCWGTAWDDHGQIFHGSGADFTIWHTTPALVPTLHPLNLGAGLAGSRGKSMEPEFLVSSHLPEDLRGVLLKSTYFTSQVQLYRLRDDGAGFTSEELGDLLASAGNEFRPVETRVGPDGAIYVCDWLNPVIGHYQASYRDPRRDRSHGRIWRLTAKDRPLSQWEPLGALGIDTLLEKLRSPERWERDMAKQALYRRPKSGVITALDRKIASSPPEPEPLLYEWSGIFAAHEEPRLQLVERLLASPNFRWRAWGAHLCGVWADRLPRALDLLAIAVGDEHPRVRLEAVVACSWQKNAAAVKVATLALEKPQDRSISHALTQTIHALAPRWQPVLQAGQLDFGDRFHALAKILTTVGDTSVVPRIHELLKSGNFTGPARDSLLGVLIENGGPADVEFAIGQAPDSPAVLDSLINVAFRKKDTGYHAVLQQLLSSPHSIGRIAGCRVAAAWRQHFGTAERIRQITQDPNGSLPERRAAMDALASVLGKDAAVDLLKLAESPQAGLRQAALAALAPLDRQAVAQKAAATLATVKSAAEAGPLLAPLLNLKDGAEILAQYLTANKPPAEAARLALQWMGEVGRDDAPLRLALNSAAGINPLNLNYSEALVERLVMEAQSTGSAERGAALLKSAQSTCLTCHKVGAEGGILGPELSALGRAMTPEMITEAVLWPKRQVKEGFLLTSVAMKDGRQFQGYKQKESPELLTLKDLATGTEQTLAKADIASRNDAGTLMPEGLTAWMTESQRADLLRSLFELGK